MGSLACVPTACGSPSEEFGRWDGEGDEERNACDDALLWILWGRVSRVGEPSIGQIDADLRERTGAAALSTCEGATAVGVQRGVDRGFSDGRCVSSMPGVRAMPRTTFDGGGVPYGVGHHRMRMLGVGRRCAIRHPMHRKLHRNDATGREAGEHQERHDPARPWAEAPHSMEADHTLHISISPPGRESEAGLRDILIRTNRSSVNRHELDTEHQRPIPLELRPVEIAVEREQQFAGETERIDLREVEVQPDTSVERRARA